MNQASHEPDPSYLKIRNRIFNLEPSEVGLSQPSGSRHVWGVLMETGYDVGTATLVSFADGTTSLYYSTGGGMIGSSNYIPVAEASKALVAEAEHHIHHLSPTTDFALPGIGEVRFYFMTYDGILLDETTGKDLVAGRHTLSPLYEFAQEALTQLRLLAVAKR